MSASETDLIQSMASRKFVVLLVLVSIVGVVTALAAWCFLELSHQIEVGVFEKLPEQLGFDGTPAWWPIPVAAIGGLIVAFAVVRLPGGGGHVPAHGLDTSTPTLPIDIPRRHARRAGDDRARARARP